MAQIDAGLREFKAIDELSMRDSLVHRLGALPKFIITIAYIAFVVSISKYELSRLVPFVIYPLLMFDLSNTSIKGFFVKLRYVLPLVLAVGIVNPFIDREVFFVLGNVNVTGGLISMLTLMIKGVYCLMASYVLIATTRFEAICAGLRRIHIPGIFVTLMLLTYRYIFVFLEELSIMNEAYRLRAPLQKGIHYTAWGSFLGQAFLRSMDRAQELFHAMRLRGFDEEYRFVVAEKLKGSDIVYMVLVAAALILLKAFDISAILGALVVR